LPPNAAYIRSSSSLKSVGKKWETKTALSELEHEFKQGMWEMFLERSSCFDFRIFPPVGSAWANQGPFASDKDFQEIENFFKVFVKNKEPDVDVALQFVRRRMAKRRADVSTPSPPAKISRTRLPLGPPIIRSHTEAIFTNKGKKRLRVTDETASDIRFIAPDCRNHPFAKVYVVHDRQGLRYWRCEMGCFVTGF
jgi:hypothetical protein